MKLLLKNSVLAVVLFTLIFSSCKFESEKETELVFKTYKYSEKVHLFDNENYPSSQIDIRINIPTDSIYFKDLTETILMEFFDSIYKPQFSVDEMCYQYFQDLSADYKEMEEFYQEDSAYSGSSYNWETIVHSGKAYQVDHFLTIMNEFYSYTGGAHGNTTRHYYVYDLSQNKVLKANEVFNLENCAEIIDLQKESLSEIEDLGNLWLDGLKCDNNFYVVESGFIFHYDQYEIAPYAAGPMDVFVKFEDIEPYLLQAEYFKALKKE